MIAAVLLGYFRVKRERKSFRTRIVWGWTEFIGLLKEGLQFALIYSVLIAGIGLVVPMEWLWALSIVSIIVVISGIYQLASFVYLAAGAVALGWLFRKNDWSFGFLDFEYNGYFVEWQWLFPVALIAGAILIAEGVQIAKHGAISASPALHKTQRGMRAAVYLPKRLWLLPVLFVVPGSFLESYAPYWPQFPLGESMFSFVLFPVVFGFQSRARRTLPLYFYPKVGKATWITGVGVIVLTLTAFFWEPMALIALAAGCIGRLFVSVYFAVKERQGNHIVAPQPTGVMIVDVLPNSPAEKMGLLRGEVIRKVNGLTVTNESELYEAIQVNAAHCRLEVLDHNREVRLRQHVVFRHDHHRLGLIVVN